MVAEFTVNHAKRSQLRMNLGISATNTTTPASTWFPTYVLSNAGGAYAFNGGTTAMDGTFFFDFTELVPTTTTAKRWYVGAYDNASGDPATLKSFRLFEVKDTGDVLAGTAANVPQTADGGQQVYAWVDYTYNSGNMAPVAVISASPTAGSVPLTVSFDGSGSYDPDGVIASYSWNFGDGGTASGAAVSHTYTSAGTFTATLVVTDSKGVTSETNEVIVVTDPNVLDAPSGLSATVNRPTVTLNWTDNSGNETNFYVERGVKAKGKTTWSRVGTVGANVTTLSQSVADGSYQYRVQAYSSTTGRTSAYSNTVSVTVGSSKGKPPKK
jgi:PKD repeat protein